MEGVTQVENADDLYEQNTAKLDDRSRNIMLQDLRTAPLCCQQAVEVGFGDTPLYVQRGVATCACEDLVGLSLRVDTEDVPYRLRKYRMGSSTAQHWSFPAKRNACNARKSVFSINKQHQRKESPQPLGFVNGSVACDQGQTIYKSITTVRTHLQSACSSGSTRLPDTR